MKLVMVPFGLAVVAIVAVRRGMTRRDVAAFGSAVLAVCAAVVAVLGLRGELPGYLDTQVANVTYSQGGALHASGLPALVDHLRAVLGPGEVTGLIAMTVVLALVVSVRAREHAANTTAVHVGEIRALATAALVLGLASTAAIGLWGHHAQVFGVAGALTALLITAFIADTRSWAATAAAVCSAALIGGVPTAGAEAYVGNVIDFPVATARLAEVSPLAREVRVLTGEGSYARIGAGEQPPGHAAGLEEYALACRRFHQYWFQTSEELDEVIACLPSADLVLVEPFDRFALETAATRPSWARFLAEVDDLLAREFTCVPAEGGQLCVRRL